MKDDFNIKASEVREFATDRLLENSKIVNSFSNSPKEIWKSKGKIDFANELLHWLNHYDEI